MCAGVGLGHQSCWPHSQLVTACVKDNTGTRPAYCWAGASEYAFQMAKVTARTSLQAELNPSPIVFSTAAHLFVVHMLASPTDGESAQNCALRQGACGQLVGAAGVALAIVQSATSWSARLCMTLRWVSACYQRHHLACASCDSWSPCSTKRCRRRSHVHARLAPAGTLRVVGADTVEATADSRAPAGGTTPQVSIAPCAESAKRSAKWLKGTYRQCTSAVLPQTLAGPTPCIIRP